MKCPIVIAWLMLLIERNYCQKSSLASQYNQKTLRKFPDDFIFGASTSAYQIEGGWDADGKGPSLWDTATHTYPGLIFDGSTGDIADDSYHKYKRDVQMMRELGLNAYRFSISWPRILPNGRANNINKAGVAFYNNYINEMLKYNITPIVTLYHLDIPQTLQDMGGFFNSDISVWFKEYARVAFTMFGDRVKRWLTFNELKSICTISVMFSENNFTKTGFGEYLCAKNLAFSHATVYKMYVNEFKDKQKGECGLTTSIEWFEPLTNTTDDQFATKIRQQVEWGIYVHPIFSQEGGFPKEISEIVAKKSLQQGYNTSRMPEFTEEEINFVRGTYDFFGMNHYSASLVFARKYKLDIPVPSLEDDIDVGAYYPENWPRSASTRLLQAPNSMYNAITNLKQQYQLDTTFYIFENGWSTESTAGLVDDDRVRYHRASLESLLDAIADGVKVKGYMVWSLMDNFEWEQGYSKCFGLYQVNYDDPERTRTPRLSAFVYKDIIKKRYIDYSYSVDMTTASMSLGTHIHHSTYQTLALFTLSSLIFTVNYF